MKKIAPLLLIATLAVPSQTKACLPASVVTLIGSIVYTTYCQSEKRFYHNQVRALEKISTELKNLAECKDAQAIQEKERLLNEIKTMLDKTYVTQENIPMLQQLVAHKKKPYKYGALVGTTGIIVASAAVVAELIFWSAGIGGCGVCCWKAIRKNQVNDRNSKT